VPSPLEAPPAPQHPDPSDRRPANRCDCQRQGRLREPAIGSFLDHHLRLIARLAAYETEWVCPSTLLHWRLIDHGGASRELVRLDPIPPPVG
jgi:hypothetical protein